MIASCFMAFALQALLQSGFIAVLFLGLRVTLIGAADSAANAACAPKDPAQRSFATIHKAILTRTCVFYNESVLGEEAFARQMYARALLFCPTFAKRYLATTGVSLLPLPEPDDNVTNSSAATAGPAMARLLNTQCFLSREFGGELAYLRHNRTLLVDSIASVEWDGSTADDAARRLDLLTCATLFPPCDVIDDELLEILPCDWLCEDIRNALLPVARTMAAQSPVLFANGFYNLLNMAIARCVPNNAKTNSLLAGTSRAAFPPRCQNCSSINCQRTEVTTMSYGTSAARGPAGRLCFNSSGICGWPFVSTARSTRWDSHVQDRLKLVVGTVRVFLNMSEAQLPYNGSVFPCARDCQTSVVLSEDEETSVRTALRVFSWMVFVGGLVALGSFALDWNRMNRYPKRILFFLNLCVFLGNFGILAQDLTPNADSYLCHGDGSVRINEPSDSGACTVLFIILYFFLMCSVGWWVCLSHAWCVTLPCIKTPDFGVSKNKHYEKWYHLFVWPTFTALTIAQLGSQEVGGLTLYGVCWMYRDVARFGYMVIPVTFASVLGTGFLIHGMRGFYKERNSWRQSMVSLHAPVLDKECELPGGELRNDLERKKKKKEVRLSMKTFKKSKVEQQMRLFLIKLWLLLMAVQFHMVVQAAVGIVRQVNWDRWVAQARTHTTCLFSTCHAEGVCPPLPTPSVVLIAFPVVAATTFALSTYIWVLNRETYLNWKKLVRRIVYMVKTRSLEPEPHTRSDDYTVSENTTVTGGTVTYTVNATTGNDY